MTQDEALHLLQSGSNVFLTGPAGSGKTFVLQQFIDWLAEEERDAAVTASTGIAATHLGGTTIHSWGGIGISDRLNPREIDELLQREYLHKRFNNVETLIIDEISMLDAPRLDLINVVLQEFRGNHQPFGGIQVVFSGDFFQLPPVTRGSQEPQFAFESAAWDQLGIRTAYLDHVYRQSGDPLLQILNEIRAGQVSEDSIEQLQERLEEDTPTELEPTKLYTHNIDVDAVNAEHLASLPGKPKTYYMTTSGKKPNVEQLKKSCLAPEELDLKEGARVMFLKNNFQAGYVNGTLGTVVSIKGPFPEVETDDGKTIMVEPDTWSAQQDGVVRAELEQLPLRLAWAITVHKSQGMTLDAAEIQLAKSFAPGMGYVALSRVRSLSGIYIKGINQQALQVSAKVQEFDKKLQQHDL